MELHQAYDFFKARCRVCGISKMYICIHKWISPSFTPFIPDDCASELGTDTYRLLSLMSSEEPNDNLQKVITVRVSQRFFEGLEEKRKRTNCQTVSEMVRAILYKEKIIFYYTDATLNATAVELAGIRKELNLIGNNINQIAKQFHSADSSSQKMFYALKVAEEYKRVDAKVDKLLIMISQIAEKWLQG